MRTRAMAYEYRKFYIDGQWVEPANATEFKVINPATEEVAGVISMGTAADVDRAVAAARRAFDSFSQPSGDDRRGLLEKILAVYKKRYVDVANAIRDEMGAPTKLANGSQAGIGVGHLTAMIDVLKNFKFEDRHGPARLVLEPIGVCALITPWNWPINQVAAKVVPALAAGCTMVLKPSEFSPFSAMVWAEVLHEAGVPKGVFNLINGTGIEVGAALASHPEVDMVSFTGSTRAGTEVAKLAAPTVKRVHQELGGKSPNILLDDVDLEAAVTSGVNSCFSNSGQSCNAPTRMLVPAARHDEAVAIAQRAAAAPRIGPADDDETTMGPVVSDVQYARVQRLIEMGIEEGALLAAGGPGRPDGLTRGYYVRPTVFANVAPSMTIAREEIFGPVLAIMPYRDEEDAIAIANDTPFGLAAYVQSADQARARRIALRLRAGSVYLNYPAWDAGSPFGGYKQSGNGREYGEWGLEAFLEVKGIVGY